MSTVRVPDAKNEPVGLAVGNWRAWLDSPGGPLPFGLEISEGNGRWQAWVVNGPERMAIDRVVLEPPRVVLDFAHYDARLEATWSDQGARLDGRWVKTGAGDTEDSLPFHATLGGGYRFAPEAGPDDPVTPIAGQWAVDFSSSDAVAIGQFRQMGREVQATFLTDTGDYRFLEGSMEGDLLRLSVFDGAHAFLFRATLGEEGTLSGDFWSRQSWHETWTATRSDTVALADPMGLTRVDTQVDWGALSFPDLEGTPRSLDDPAWSSGPRLIQVMGTWCPNCSDSTDLLLELHDKYHPAGLQVVSLAFEHTGRFERDARVVRTYQSHKNSPWTYLVAGLSKKAEASKSLPILDQVRAYPTVLFVEADGTVAAVHTGFVGPAAPEEHAQLRATYERLVRGLLE